MKKIYCFAFTLTFYSTLFSQSSLDSLKSLLPSSKEDTFKVLLLNTISFYYTDKQADTALFYAKQSIPLAKKLAFKKGEAFATLTLARCLGTVGNFPKSIEYGLASLRIFEDLDDKANIAFNYGQLADIYRDEGDFQRALFYCSKSNDLFQHLDVKPPNSSLGSVRKIGLAVMASIYERTHQFDSALSYVQRAYELDVKETGGRFGWLTIQRGKIEAGLKHTDVALSLYRSAIPLVIANETPKDLLEIYNSIAKLYSDNGEIDSSIYYARQSLKYGGPSAYEKGILEAMTLLSQNYKAKKMSDSAVKYLEMSVALRDSMYSQQKERDIQYISFNEQLRQQDLAEAKAKLAKERRSNLQMLAMGAFIVTLISGVFVISRRRSFKVVQFLGIVGLLLAFEFIALLTHPWIEHVTNHTPIYSLLLLVLIASILVPAHHFFEGLLKNRIVKQNAKAEEEKIDGETTKVETENVLLP